MLGHTWLSFIKTNFKHFGETPVLDISNFQNCQVSPKNQWLIDFLKCVCGPWVMYQKNWVFRVFWERRLGALRTAGIFGSSLLQVLIPAQEWSTYTWVSLEIAFFPTHKSSVDFPSKSVGSGAGLQDSLRFLAYNQSWNSQVHALLKVGASTLIIRGTFTHFKPMFPCRTHAVQGVWTKHTYHMCVWYIFPKFPRSVSVSGCNIFVQVVTFVVYLE